MKTLLILIALISSVSVQADEVDGIGLIIPLSYERTPKKREDFRSSAKVWIGDKLGMADIAPKINESIAPYKKDLAAYFKSPVELDALIDYLVATANKDIIGYKSNGKLDDVTDAKVIEVNRFFGNKLIGKITDKILEAKGVSDSNRRDMWVKKILTPFNNCMVGVTNALYGADHCMSALTSSLVPSTGIGLVYELSRSNLNAALPADQRNKFNNDQVSKYKACMSRTKSTPADVEKCAVSAMREGVVYVTDLSLTKTIKEAASSSTKAASIKATVLAPFKSCVAISSESAQFTGCIDSLMQSTGMLLVEDKINNNLTLKENFSKSEISKLSGEKVLSFRQCMEQLKKNNVRVSGLLDTSVCENAITNEITYKAVTKILAQTAADTLKSEPGLIDGAAQSGKKFLDQCWKNTQSSKERESCLRKTILSFSEVLGESKLDKAVPANLKNRDAIIKVALEDLNKCLSKELPANISEAANLTQKTSLCTNKLTQNVALTVAHASVKSEAEAKNLTEAETNQLLNVFVSQNFSKCLGAAPSDAQLDKCAGSLKRGVALKLADQQIRTNAKGKVPEKDVDGLVDRLVTQKFGQCIGQNPTDDQLDHCVGNLTKEATKAIVLSYEKQQIKEQLSADFTPASIKPVENNFIACTEKNYPDKQVSKAIDECTKQFAIDFAKTLGALKMTTLMKSILGTDNFTAQAKSIDRMIQKYNDCLNDLKKFNMEDGLLDKLSICTDSLQRDGERFVASAINEWMSTDQKDLATVRIKREFAQIVPCLSVLMPTTPYNPEMQANADSILKPVALILAQYIEYDPDSAKQTLDQIIKKLQTDLKDVATNPESRKGLIDMLYQNGALDQFLKSMVRGQVKDSFATTSEEELPTALRNALLTKENFEKIFNTPEGKAIKDAVMDKILKPVLMDQAGMSSPFIKSAMESVKDNVVKLLVYSPHFGEQIVKASVQSKIDNMGGITKFFAKALYGKNALNWEKVRTTKSGIEAEQYIRDNVLMPKFKGITLRADEEKKTLEEAEKLVKAAVKNYDE